MKVLVLLCAALAVASAGTLPASSRKERAAILSYAAPPAVLPYGYAGYGLGYYNAAPFAYASPYAPAAAVFPVNPAAAEEGKDEPEASKKADAPADGAEKKPEPAKAPVYFANPYVSGLYNYAAFPGAAYYAGYAAAPAAYYIP